MKLMDKIEKFDMESKKTEELYEEWGTTREEHQKKMLGLIQKKLDDVKRK